MFVQNVRAIDLVFICSVNRWRYCKKKQLLLTELHIDKRQNTEKVQKTALQMTIEYWDQWILNILLLTFPLQQAQRCKIVTYSFSIAYVWLKTSG